MIEIRSYRRVFDLERRVYSIDSLRLNPGGVPVRGVLYFVSILCLILLTGRLPFLSSISQVLPWYIRDLLLPGAGATVLGMIRLEGRTFHLAAMALGRCWLGPRLLFGLRPCASVPQRWYPQDILILPDGSDARLRRMRYKGPGAVWIAVEHERGGNASEKGTVGLARGARTVDVTVTAGADAQRLDRAKVLLLGERARMLVRPRGSS